MERKEKIKGWLITEKEARVAEFVPSLESYYKMLDCELIGIVSRKIGEHYYDIICDDEGLLKEEPRVSAIQKGDWSPMLCGNLLVVKHDDEGNEVGLTDEEIEECRGQMMKVGLIDRSNNKAVKSWSVIICEY